MAKKARKKSKSLDIKIKRLNKTEKGKFFFCPRCGSMNVKPLLLEAYTAGFSPIMTCIECGFRGFVLKSSRKNISEYRKKVEKEASC